MMSEYLAPCKLSIDSTHKMCKMVNTSDLIINMKTFSIRKIQLLLLMVSTLLNLDSFAQAQIPDIIPPSPEAVALGTYGTIPVGHYSGVPNINLPLYTVAYRDLQIPISVSYHASGIKVTQESSMVGLGWVLNAGGIISRTVVNEDDLGDEVEHKYFSETEPSIPSIIKHPSNSGLFYHDVNGTMPAGSVIIDYYDGTSDDLTDFFGADIGSDYYDFEPDQYNYNFGGYSGKFIISKGRKVITGKQDVLDFKLSADATIWTVRASDGSTYIFDVVGTVNVNAYEGDSQNYISSWRLSRIISPTGAIATFLYNSDQLIQESKIGKLSQSYNWGGGTQSSSGVPTLPTPGPPMEYTESYLTEIDSPNGKVKFEYSDREDIHKGKKLDLIRIYSKKANGESSDDYMKSIEFDYDYFVGDQDDDYNAMGHIDYITDSLLTHRLKLLAINEFSNGLYKPLYSFKYYEPGGVYNMPTKNSFAQDHWGYFNGEFQNTSLIHKFDGVVVFPDEVKVKAAEKATFQGYPFDQHKIIDGGDRSPNENFVKAWMLKELKYPTGGSSVFEYGANEFSNESLNEPVNGSHAKYIYNTGQQTGTFDLTDAYVSEVGTNLDATITTTFRCQGNCDDVLATLGDIRIQYDIGVDTYTADFYHLATDPQNNIIRTTTYANNTGPVVINWTSNIDASIEGFADINVSVKYSKNPNGEAIQIGGGARVEKIISKDELGNEQKTVAYKYGNGTTSYGLLHTPPAYNTFGYDKVYYFTDISHDFMVEETQWTFTRSSASINDIFQSGQAVAYSMVEEMVDDGSIGKSVYHYFNEPTLFADYRGWQNAPIQGFNNPLNGILEKKLDYEYLDGQFRVVNQIENYYSRHGLYNEPTSSTGTVYGIKKVLLTYKGNISYNNTGEPTEPPEHSLMLFAYPAIKSDWIRLDSTLSTIYSYPEGVKDSLSSKVEMFYDNTSHKLKTREKIYKSDGTVKEGRYYYSDDVTTGSDVYTQMINSFRLNDQVRNETLEGAEIKRSQSNYYEYDTDKFAVASIEILEGQNMEEVASIDSYDSHGNITQFSKRDGTINAYIWGYNGQYPVVEASNASHAELAPFANSIIAASEQDIDHCLASESCEEQNLRMLLSQLRDQPSLSEAMITTYTYDPLVGVTSISDVNNETQYFIYDNFQRLVQIKDDDGNLLKQYEYNFQSTGLDYELIVEGSGGCLPAGSPFRIRANTKFQRGQTSYSWDLGDGNTVVTEDRELVYTYSTPGDYQIHVTGTNSELGVYTSAAQVSVGGEVSGPSLIEICDLGEEFTFSVAGCIAGDEPGFLSWKVIKPSGVEVIYNNPEHQANFIVLDEQDLDETGAYEVVFENGQVSNEWSFALQVNRTPPTSTLISVPSIMDLCQSGSQKLTVTNATDCATYEWVAKRGTYNSTTGQYENFDQDFYHVGYSNSLGEFNFNHNIVDENYKYIFKCIGTENGNTYESTQLEMIVAKMGGC